MAKTSCIERNKKRIRLAAVYADKRKELKAIARDTDRPTDERFEIGRAHV